jgi:hypothetical protein
MRSLLSRSMPMRLTCILRSPFRPLAIWSLTGGRRRTRCGSWTRPALVWFVDKTGLGHEWEPALTVEQFKRQLREYVGEHPGHGFAITEEGEFQVYVSAFKPMASGRKRGEK